MLQATTSLQSIEPWYDVKLSKYWRWKFDAKLNAAKSSGVGGMTLSKGFLSSSSVECNTKFKYGVFNKSVEQLSSELFSKRGGVIFFGCSHVSCSKYDYLRFV